jgi:alkanesulfonate monooxygenase SsuD/methylene tetrahydromethanopterin reductase-like flavin-dependent oxidoreductase (luciferase family)
LSYFGAKFAEVNFKKYWNRVEAAGLDQNPYRTGMVQLVMVADTDAEAKRLYEKHVQYFFQRCTHIYPGFTEAPGYKSVESLKEVLPAKGASSASRADSFAAAQKYSWEQMVEMGIVIGGSADTVRERLEAASRANSIGNWVLLMHIGSMPKELAMYNIDLFSEKVLPSLSGVFADQPHHWWPKPIPGFTPSHVAPVHREVQK